MKADVILEKHLLQMLGRVQESYVSIEEMRKQPEWGCTINAMIEYAEQEVKNCNALAVSNRRELLIGFKQWEIDNDIKNLLPEQMVDWYLEDEAN